MAEGRGAIRAIIEAVDRVTGPVKRMGAGVSYIIRSLNLDQARAQISRVVAGFTEVGRAALMMTAKIMASSIGVVTALAAITRSVAETTQASITAARSVNVSLQGWQQFAHAATLVGSNADQMGGALGSLRDKALEAARGNWELRVAFRRMGVQLLDSRGQLRPTEDLMHDVADAFARIPDSARRNAAAMALFGDAGAALIPLLATGSAGMRRAAADARHLGLTMSAAEARGLTRFNTAMTRMTGSIRGVWNAIAVQLAPVLSPLIDDITEWVATNRQLIATNIAGYIRQIPGVIEDLSGKVRALLSFMQPGIAVLMEWVDWFGRLNTVLLVASLYLGRNLIAAVGRLTAAIAGPMIAAIGGMITALRGGATVMAAFNATLWANPIGVVLLAITALGTAAWLIVKYWEPIKAFFSGLWEAVKGHFNAFIGWLADLFAPEIDGIQTVWRRLPAFFAGMWSDVRGFFTGFVGWLDSWTGGALTSAYNAITAAWEALPAFFSGIWDRVRESFDAVWGWIRPIIDRVENFRLPSFGGSVAPGAAPTQPGLNPGATGQPGTVRRGTVNGARRIEGFEGVPNVTPVTPGSAQQRVDLGGELNIRIHDDRVEVSRAETNDPRIRVRASTESGPYMARHG